MLCYNLCCVARPSRLQHCAELCYIMFCAVLSYITLRCIVLWCAALRCVVLLPVACCASTCAAQHYYLGWAGLRQAVLACDLRLATCEL